MLTRPVKFSMYCLIQWISKLLSNVVSCTSDFFSYFDTAQMCQGYFPYTEVTVRPFGLGDGW